MGKITLEGMQFKSHIGVYDYEQLYGNNFEVDVYVTSSIINGNTDELAGTIDYEIIYSIAKISMSKNFKLVESACKEILETIKGKFNNLDKVMVRIIKLHPPLGDEVKKVSVEMDWRKQS